MAKRRNKKMSVRAKSKYQPYQLLLGNDVNSMLDPEVHILRSHIEFKWSIAEAEIALIVVNFGLKDCNSLSENMKGLSEEFHRFGLSKEALELFTKLKRFSESVRQDRNTLVHGRLSSETLSMRFTTDQKGSAKVPPKPLFQGSLSVVRKGNVIPLTLDTLRDLDQRMDRLIELVAEFAKVVDIELNRVFLTLHEFREVSEPGQHPGPLNHRYRIIEIPMADIWQYRAESGNPVNTSIFNDYPMREISKAEYERLLDSS